MPQDYHPVLLDSHGAIRAWVCPDKYGCDRKLMSHALSAPFVNAIEMLLTPEGGFNKSRLVWAGEYADPEPGTNLNLHKISVGADKTNQTELFPEESDTSYYGFIVNHTKCQFISKARCEKYTRLQPLPLLTASPWRGWAEGDYPLTHNLVGYWARDVISVVKQPPLGFVEIVFDLV